AAVLTFGPAGAFGILPTPDGRMLHLTTSAGQAWLAPAGGIVPPGGDPSSPRDFMVPEAPPASQAQPGGTAGHRIAPRGQAPLAGLPFGGPADAAAGPAAPERVALAAAAPVQAPQAVQD